MYEFKYQYMVANSSPATVHSNVFLTELRTCACAGMTRPMMDSNCSQWRNNWSITPTLLALAVATVSV